MSNQADIIAAIAQIAENTEGELTKKPNVADIEALTGFDISADERDEAWKAFTDTVDSDSDAVDSDATIVTNNMASTLSIFGVTIPPKKSAPVPDFDGEKSVIATWLDAELISVENAD